MGPAEVGVIGAYVLVLVGIAIYARRYSGTVGGFLIGDRGVGPWVAGISYFATYFSSSVLVGNAGTGYTAGISWMLMPVPQVILLPLGFLVVGLGLRRMSAQMGAVTVPDYVRDRFQSPSAGLIANLSAIVFLVPYMVAVTTAGALVAEQLLDIPYSASVAIIIVGSAMYIALGGYMAGALTDVFQGVIILVLGLVLFFVAFATVGGPAGAVDRLAEVDPSLVDTPGPLGWTGLFAFAVVFSFAPWGLPQLAHKFMSMRSTATVFAGGILIAIMAGTILVAANGYGVLGRAYFGNELVDNPDSVLPALATEMLPAVLSTMLLVAVVSAVMSTIDAVLLTVVGGVTRDIYQRMMRPNVSDSHVIFLTRLIAIGLGVFVAWLALDPPDLVLELTTYAFSVVAAVNLPVLLLGLYWRKTTATGAIAAQIAALVATLVWYEALGEPLLHPFYVGVLAGFVAGVVVSRFTRPVDGEHVRNLFARDSRVLHIDES